MKHNTYPHRNSYPNEFKLKGKRIKVKFEVIIANDPDCLGLYDPNNRTITLKEGLCGELLASTFTHELLHAIEDVYKFRIKHTTVEKLELPLTQIVHELFGFIFRYHEK